MFKNVKFMSDGWFDRHEQDLDIALSVTGIIFIIEFFLYLSSHIVPNASVNVITLILVIIIGLINLKKTNDTVAHHQKSAFKHSNQTLKELNTIPKIYDKFFLIMASILPIILFIIITVLTSNLIALIADTFGYFLVLFDISTLTRIILDISQLEKFYKINK